MTDIICISSSEDEEELSKKQSESILQKRRLSINLDVDEKIKRLKIDNRNEQFVSGPSTPVKKLSINLDNKERMTRPETNNRNEQSMCGSFKSTKRLSINSHNEERIKRLKIDDGNEQPVPGPFKPVKKLTINLEDEERINSLKIDDRIEQSVSGPSKLIKKLTINLGNKESIKSLKTDDRIEQSVSGPSKLIKKLTINLGNKESIKSLKTDDRIEQSVPGPSKPVKKLTINLEDKESIESPETDDRNEQSGPSKPVKKIIKPQLVVREKIPIPEPAENIFMKFLDVCERKKPNYETKKILSKIKKRYDSLNSLDKNDENFQSLLKINLQQISNDNNDRFYFFISEVNNEIKRLINFPKISIASNKKSNCSDEHEAIEEYDTETVLSKDDLKKLKKIDKAIKLCQIKIKELEEKEVDFDEDEDSAYLQEDRYKRKLVELFSVRNRIVEDKMLKKEIYKRPIKRKDIPDEMTGISSVDEAIINIINRNIIQLNKLKHIKNPNAIADYLAVPDYHDILDCIQECNSQKNLKLTKQKMEQLAVTAFRSVGSYLKKQRIRECKEHISSYAETSTEIDPATINPELNNRLKINKKEGDKKLEEVFQKFEDKAKGLSLEDLQKLEDKESDVNDNSDNEISEKNTEINSINGTENEMIQDPNKENLLENKNNAAEDSSVSNKERNNDDDSKSILKLDVSDIKNNEIKTFINKLNCTDNSNIIKNDENKSKDCNPTDNLWVEVKKNKVCEIKKTIVDTNMNKVVKSSDSSTSLLSPTGAKKLSCHSSGNKMKVVSLAIDDDEIQLLSDDEDDIGYKNKSKNTFCTVSKQKDKALSSNGKSLMNHSGVNKIKETNCKLDYASKDNNSNKHEGKISNKESSSTSRSPLNENKKSKSNDESKKKMLQNELSTNEVEENDDIEILPNNKDSENVEDKNSTNFLKVCSFAKSPESWKDSLSPEKIKRNLQLPIQQALQDLNREKNKMHQSVQKALINPTIRINHNGSLAVDSATNVKVVNVNRTNIAIINNLSTSKTLPNNHQTKN